jgi:uncharacterized membrane protein
MTRFLVPLAIIASVVTTRCLAEVKVCNDYREVVYVALGWVDAGDTKTTGWWSVATGECKIVDDRPLRSPHYLHVQTASKKWVTIGRSGAAAPTGGVKLAVSDQQFDYAHSQTVATNDYWALFEDISKAAGRNRSVAYRVLNDGTHAEATYYDAVAPAPSTAKKPSGQFMDSLDKSMGEIKDNLTGISESRAGLDAYKRGQYQEALDHFTRALVGSTSAVDYYNRGLAYYQLKQYQSAARDFEQANRMDKAFADAQEMWRRTQEAMLQQEGFQRVK